MNNTAFPAVLVLVGMAAPAWADAVCIANMGRFERGQYACLRTGETSQLARCEVNGNVLSWNEVLDHCPGGPQPRSAPASFVCRANGQFFPAGGFACLTVSGSRHLARCDAVLNNSSWTNVQEGCPGGPQPEVVPDPQGYSRLQQILAVPRRLIERIRDAL